MTKSRASSLKRVYGEKQTNRLIWDYECADCGGRAFVEFNRVRVLHDLNGCRRYARLVREHPKMYDRVA